MSQAAMVQETNSRLLPAFNKAPSNPYKEMVDEGLKQQEIDPQSLPGNNNPEPTTPPADVTPPEPKFTPIDMPTPDAAAWMQAIEQERLKAANEAAEKDKVIANLLEQQKEYEALKQQMAMQKAVADNAFDNLNSVDAEDAKAISNTVLAATNAALAPLYKELEESRKQTAAQFAQNAQAARAAQINEYNRRILAKHPDYFDLMNTKEYRAFMSGRDGLSSKSRDQRAAEEFLAGNTDYVIDLLDRLKGKTPSTEQIQSVAPVQTAPAAPTPEKKGDELLDLGTLNSLYQMRQITHDEYVKRLKAWRAAQSKE